MRYRVPADLAWIDGAEHGEEPSIYLMSVPNGRPIVLSDSAALIWLAAWSAADPVAEVARLTDQDADTVRPDIETFLADLVARGLLTPTERPA